ncbi:50S ribosomal protein L23 [Candidatus Micrarchaeota archaeon]|nr:50S ribosomal protein L23 [Candidatus Micrarchaeota archaeon]
MTVVRYPLITEKAVGMIEKQNIIVFAVDEGATKADVKRDVEKLYGVKVAGVNTSTNIEGVKKAFVRLTPEFKAGELAAKLKIL